MPQHLRTSTPPLSAYAPSLASSSLDAVTPSSTIQGPFGYPMGANGFGYFPVPQGEFSFECGVQGQTQTQGDAYAYVQQQQQQPQQPQQYYQQQLPQSPPRLQLNPHRAPKPQPQPQQQPLSASSSTSPSRSNSAVTTSINGIPTTTNANSQPVLSLSSIAQQIATRNSTSPKVTKVRSPQQQTQARSPQAQPQMQQETPLQMQLQQPNPYPQLQTQQYQQPLPSPPVPQPQPQSQQLPQFQFTITPELQAQLHAQTQLQAEMQSYGYAIGQDVGINGLGSEQAKRPGGACTRCKKMKMKCTFLTPTSPACQRCLTTSHPCIVEGRKPRTPSQREALLAQIREKDAIIAKLLGPYVKERDEVAGGTKVVLMGGRVVGALEGGQGGTHGKRGMSIDSAGMTSRATSLVPVPERSATMPTTTSLGPTERAALLSAEKGGLSASGASAGATASAVTANMGPRGYGLLGLKKSATQDKGGGDDESDEEWSSDESESDVWDEEAERSWVNEGNTMAGSAQGTMAKEGAAGRQLYPIALPAKDAPLGLIARLSLEEAEEIAFHTRR
ncbi:hypothetical protein M422DRAFT_785752 [Sphaerobolus stellatus SS14]|uniref:Zn(2)-C6 fungal-type domain-containing protein n=1 Tax=Sphaerobolus stellatus (strain SS14) TaxID=990650 RepID=A0A0C9TSR6_SPHS4|nr:hypothetical protein M422DRAFT_785752 [Sphaerobolus stellatus SS14]